jgi:hypothetical protein
MNTQHRLQRLLSVICAVGTVGISTVACAGFLGFGGDSWKEEVLLHDGSKMVIERTVERGGRHEIGQKPPYKEQSLSFALPGTTQTITWEDHYSQDLGSANFLPMMLDISEGTPYLVVHPMGCLSYNKWGRPNPPYVIFQYQNKEWKRIPLHELPADIKMPNVILSSPDIQVEKFGKRFISADMIKQLIDGYPQPEFKTILREPLKLPGPFGSSVNCEERVLYKGYWILPNDPIGQNFIDQQTK